MGNKKARYCERAESMFGDMEETDVNLRENPDVCKPSLHPRNLPPRRPPCGGARHGLIHMPAARACAATAPNRSCATGSAYLLRISVSIHAHASRAQSVNACRVACPSMS